MKTPRWLSRAIKETKAMRKKYKKRVFASNIVAETELALRRMEGLLFINK